MISILMLSSSLLMHAANAGPTTNTGINPMELIGHTIELESIHMNPYTQGHSVFQAAACDHETLNKYWADRSVQFTHGSMILPQALPETIKKACHITFDTMSISVGSATQMAGCEETVRLNLATRTLISAQEFVTAAESPTIGEDNTSIEQHDDMEFRYRYNDQINTSVSCKVKTFGGIAGYGEKTQLDCELPNHQGRLTYLVDMRK